MPAINFQKRFAELILTGQKRQTIRLVRKYPIRQGDMLYLYTGQRTKHCESLGLVQCTSILKITLTKEFKIIVDIIPLSSIQEESDFITAEGFKSWQDMYRFFNKRYVLPFEGVLIKW